MSDIQITVMEGEYDNVDAYNRVLGYIGQKTYLGGYGFRCIPELSIIEQFKMSETFSNYSSLRKIWHFAITFQDVWPVTTLLQIAVQTAELFSPDYQVLYALDTERTPHLHFGINAFSYHPDSPVLSKEIMDNYLNHLHNLLSGQYPNMTVTLLYKGKE